MLSHHTSDTARGNTGQLDDDGNGNPGSWAYVQPGDGLPPAGRYRACLIPLGEVDVRMLNGATVVGQFTITTPTVIVHHEAVKLQGRNPGTGTAGALEVVWSSL
jgi:hypothetical protein